MTVTRTELLEVVYCFYPRGLPEYDDGYAATEEHRRLVDAARRATAAYPTWKAMVRRLEARYSVQNECTRLLAGGVEPAYSARIWLTDEKAISFHVSALGPYYGIHRSGAPGEEQVASEIARQIEATYPSYQAIPPELGNEVVPDVDVDGGPLGEATIYVCLFSIVWTWVS
jgi:hypothetical protein